jgi:hypothetical protein
MQIHDDVFIQEFETLTLKPEYFDHKGHIRLAWLYLQQYDLEIAEQKICFGIKRYAESLGATDKFHFTVTSGLVRIMAKRIEQQTSSNWQSFITHNTDLIEDSAAVLHQHFSATLLQTEMARTRILAPDLLAI